MNEELEEALKLIKNECEKYEHCFNCPLYEGYEGEKHNSYCYLMFKNIPCEWKLD